VTGVRVGEIRDWMFKAALPFWAKASVDRAHGGYVEQLTLTGVDAAVDFKRTRVTARQIYVYSHAYMMGWNEGPAVARHGFDYLVNNTWMGPDKGFARLMTREGGVKDPQPDLYDLAFVLFGFSWLYRATGDMAARDWLYRTADFIDARLKHPNGRGYSHALPCEGWRLQNPHMHLTEASLAAHAATGDNRFADTAREIAHLFSTRFLNIETGVLHEYFTDDWKPAPGEKGRMAEPGHQMEWCWILSECRKQMGVDATDAIRSAASFASKHGVDAASGATYNAVLDDGTPLDRGSRTWPNTERVKCAIALYETFGADPRPELEVSVGILLDRYLAGPLPGGLASGAWIDAFDGEGRPTATHIPTSTLYHVFLAFAEVLRIEARLD
jgi:mannose/cellobiose epimerase-like protein (N-acyl-D-glucosamine 2-epimerase family)